MMTRLRRTAKYLYRKMLIAQAGTQLARLEQFSASGRLVAAALKETWHGVLSAEERNIIDQIERLRHQLDRSQAPIMIIDYGAGDTHETRTAAEMEHGKQLEVTVGQMSQISKYEIWVLMLLKLIRQFKPSLGVELGTAVGISAAYQGSAMQLNGQGSLITLEGAPALADLSRQNLQSLGVTSVTVVTGRFHDTLPKVLGENPTIDYAFIDGHHDGDATLAYFEQFFPHLSDRAVLVFDDILYYESMRRAWDKLASDRRIHLAVDLQRMGICIVDKSTETHLAVRIPMV